MKFSILKLFSVDERVLGEKPDHCCFRQHTSLWTGLESNLALCGIKPATKWH